MSGTSRKKRNSETTGTLDLSDRCPACGCLARPVLEGMIRFHIVRQDRRRRGQVGRCGCKLPSHVALRVKAVMNEQTQRSDLLQYLGQHTPTSAQVQGPASA